VHNRLRLKEDVEVVNQYVIDKVFQYFSHQKNFIQNLQDIRSSFEESQQSIFDILASFLIKSEATSPHASKIFLDYLQKKVIQKNNCRALTKNDLGKVFNNFTDRHHNLICEVFDLSGLKGKIVFGKTQQAIPVVELLKGYIFENLRPSYHTGKLDLFDAKVVCIDGYIESISEIHHLLEKVAELKEPIVAFVRGLSDDVSHTLKVNFDRKTLFFIPVIVPFDLDGANLLNDIMVIAGGDVVSTQKGELISTVDVNALPRIDAMTIFENTVTINNKNCKSRVDSHIRFLQNKIIEVKNEATTEALTKRIKRLGTNQVNLLIPDDKNYKYTMFVVDSCIRAAKLSSKFGICEYGDATLPISSIEAGIFYAQQYQKMLIDIGCIIN
jgi:chaperonin GroEL (HSP60 family)